MIGDGVRIVLDTNQIVGAGSRWLDGAAAGNSNQHRRLLVCVAEEHNGLYCDEIIDEYLEKLLDRRHPPQRARKLIAYIMGAFIRVEVVSGSAPVPPSDPDDEIFLICALDGYANFLVSEDRALLALKASYERPVIGRCSETCSALGI